MERCGGCRCTGSNLRRYFLFLTIILPDPSTRITYWSNWHTSMTLPVLSYMVGYGFGDERSCDDGNWGEASSMFVPFLSTSHVAVAKCILTFV